MKEVDEIQSPKSWIDVRLGDFVQSEKGKKPKGLSNEKTEDFSIPYVDIQAFEKGIIDRYTDGDNCRFCEEGDFLMVWDGSRSGLVGKAIAGAIGSTIVRISFPGILDDYAYYFLQSKYRQINTRTRGSGVPHVDPNLLWSYRFPLPPLAEQHRIVAKIEELFSELDNGVAQLRQVQAQLKSYRQSVLKHAFEGKLTEAWRQQHGQLPNAQELLTAIQQERHTRHQQALKDWQQSVIRWAEAGKPGGTPLGKKPTKPKAPKELPPLTDKELSDQPSIPARWAWERAGNVLYEINNGYTPKSNKMNGNDCCVPFLKVYNLTHDGQLDLEKNLTLVSTRTHKDELTRSITHPNDVLMNIVGPPLGKVSLVPDTYAEYNINQAIVLFRPNKFYNSKFLMYALLTKSILNWILKTGKATAGQTNLKVSSCRELLIPLCSTEEQHQIVQEIESRLSVAEHLEKTVEKSLHQAEVLRQSILQRAFSGLLVPQDPNDEPAAELLQRIQEEKSGSKTQSKKAKAASTDEQLSITF